MKLNKPLLTLPIIFVLTLSACNIAFKAPSPSPNDAAATIVAMTLKAQGLPTSAGFVSTPSTPSTPSASPAASTPTVKPTLLINPNNAKCRSNSNADSKVVVTFAAGTNVDLIGKDTADNTWLVNDPGGAGLCWVQTQDGTASGSFANLPEVTPQATAPGLPARPGSISYSYNCDNASLTTDMKWKDAANNENGYRVYRDGTKIADLPADSTAYTDTTSYTPGTTVTFSVEAYDDAGASPQSSISFHCP